MSISIQQFTSGETMLQGLASALTAAGLFDTVTADGSTLAAVKGGVTLFDIAFGGTHAIDYTWRNASGDVIYVGFAAYPVAQASVSTCGSSVMLTFSPSDNNAFDFVFGGTKEGSVYAGFTYNHNTVLDNGQLISMCENTSVMYAGALAAYTVPSWSRFAPICVQSNAHVMEIADGIHGMIERSAAIPLTSAANIVPTQFTMNGVTYLTDGSFVLEDNGGES